MFNSYQLFCVFGIPIRIHGSLLILLPLFALVASGLGSLSGFLVALLIMVLLFGCVLLHELGHAVAALALGIPVHGITLYPIGGIAGLTQMPREPGKELIITAAGPIVNYILAGAFAIFYFLLPGTLVASMVWINLILATFNLLPGYPMDGGRILRAILVRKMSHTRATRIAARVGQATAVGIGLFGLVSLNFMLVAIAIFIFAAAQAELRMLPGSAARYQPRFREPFSEFCRRSDVRLSPFDEEVEIADWRRSEPRAGRFHAGGVVVEVLPDGTVRRRTWES